MKRSDLFEFNEWALWPRMLRSMITDFLHAVIERYQPYTRKAELIARAIEASKNSTVIDLCSGSLGPWLHLKPALEKRLGRKLDIVCTDKYPNAKLARRIEKLEGIRYCAESVDARGVSSTPEGTRTIFNGLHHFNPEDAKRIVKDSVNNGQSLVVFELLRRSWADVAIVLLAGPLFTILTMPRYLNPSVKNLFFTYVLPVFPLTFTWDAAVSSLRCYSQRELDAMMRQADTSGRYRWHIGRYRCNSLPVLYLVAYPKAPQESAGGVFDPYQGDGGCGAVEFEKKMEL